MIPIALAFVCLQQAPLEQHAPPQAAPERSPADHRGSAEDEEPVVLMAHAVSDITGDSGLAALRESTVRGATTSQQALAGAELMTVELHQMRQNLDQLVAAVGEMIEPPLDPERHRCAAAGDGVILLAGTKAQHAWLKEMLESCRVLDEMIDLRSMMFTVDAAAVAELEGAEHRSLIGAEAAGALSEELGRLGAESVMSPSVLTFPYQRAELQVVRQIAYVSDYEIQHVAEPVSLIADPVIDVAQEGLVMSARGLPWKADRVLLKIDLSYSVVKEPIAILETRLGVLDAPVTVQLPETTITRLDARLDLLAGETLVMRSPLPEGQELIVLVQASRVSVPSPFDVEGE